MTDAASLIGNWNYPTQVRFGVGRIKELPEACKQLGMKKPLLVTDMGLKALPMVADAVKANGAAGVPTGLFGEVKGNPTGKNLEDGIAAYKKGGHDGLIAFGGGSALDTGKAVAFMATQDRPWIDFTDYDTCVKAFKGPIAPIVTVATTAGTGSEVGRAAVFTDEVKQVKKIIFHPSMMPKIVIDDPGLTVGLPAKITAATGMDAFAHCLEALCCTFYHPMADGIATEGMRLVKEYLPAACKDGKNLEARANMMCAATMGATAFQKGLGSIHALSHPLSSLYDTHHGLGNAVFMPYVLVFNRRAIEDKLVRLAAYFGLKQQSFTGFIDWLVRFREEIGIPHKLGDAGVPLDNLDRLATLAAQDFCASENPIKMGKPEMRRVIDAAVAGRL
ncbi:MAG: iron-containing alcohol dehydrogenase [Alphaproteobacteria bacterium]|nr:iron-containing alcohol dehydrogenase [Alphaproteobacteria bacterium]